MKKVLLVLLFVPLVSFGQNYCNVYGKIRFVTIGEDYKIKYVKGSADVDIKFVNASPNKGQWKVSSIGADYKIKVVSIGEDFTVREVSNGEGCGGVRSSVDVFEASKSAYSNQNILGDVSDDTYDKLGDAVGQGLSFVLIKKAEKKYYNFVKEYEKNPSIEIAFEIEKSARKVIYLSENTAKLINSASLNSDYESSFSRATKIKDKWGPITKEHIEIIKKYGKYKKYKKTLK